MKYLNYILGENEVQFTLEYQVNAFFQSVSNHASCMPGLTFTLQATIHETENTDFDFCERIDQRCTKNTTVPCRIYLVEKSFILIHYTVNTVNTLSQRVSFLNNSSKEFNTHGEFHFVQFFCR